MRKMLKNSVSSISDSLKKIEIGSTWKMGIDVISKLNNGGMKSLGHLKNDHTTCSFSTDYSKAS